MKKIHFVLSLIILMSQLSCKEDTELEFSSPNFSTPFIGQINSQGVEFSCEIYDFGKFPIEEYGFMYSSEPVPRPENAETISAQGSPSRRFTLIGNHSLQENKTYYVVAYLKSSRGYTFSGSTEFDSRGSKGFTISSIEFPEPLYFMDTIKVSGTGFSRFKENYLVTISNTIEVEVFETNEHGFKFLLPHEFDYINNVFSEKELRLGVKVFDKSASIKKAFSFQKPTFNLQNPRTYNFNEEAIVTGTFLYSAKDYPLYIDEEGNEKQLLPNYISNDTIAMILPSDLNSTNPTIKFTIRGEEYNLNNLFLVNPTELKENQSFSIKAIDVFKIFGTNFNIFYPNKLLINDRIPLTNLFYASEINESSINLQTFDFTYFKDQALELGREFEISAKSLGVISKNKIKITLTDPIVPYLKLPRRFEEELYVLQFEEKNYLMYGNIIQQINHQNKTISALNLSIPNTIGLGNLFVQYIDNGRAILGSSTLSFPQTIGRTYIFDSKTNSISRMADFPSSAGIFLGTTFMNGKLTADISYHNGKPNQYTEKWQFDLAKNEWEKLSESSNAFAYISFNDNGETYAFKSTLLNSVQLVKLDPSSGDWINVSGEINNTFFSYRSNIIYLDGSPSLLTNDGTLLQFDPFTKELNIRSFPNLFSYYYRTNLKTLFERNNKVYFVDDFGYIMEIDLDLL
ncbi:hypothetical protein MM236_13110 [Belliella sp. DSM 107340]|uniref:IPT/TIG domain-containing protein n=1 Tax=Belliella calami TaxID=2923436 RepID=A0ABS9UQZ1_9BACT|nr:hypothetical protein [Belliella calami]MCH7398938.1 hypothetical protein [Belliella calami]